MNSYKELVTAINRLIRSLRLSTEQQKQQGETIAQHIEAHNNARNPDPPVIRSEVQIPPEVIQRYESNQSEQTKIQANTFRVSFVTMILLAIYTAFTGVTIHEIRRQNVSINESINRTAESFRIDERAWIEIDSIKKTINPPMQGFPQSFRYDVYLKNVGKTKAKGITLRKVTAFGRTFTESDARMAQEHLLMPDPKDATSIPAYPIPRVIAPNTVVVIPFTLDGAVPQYDNYFRYPMGRIDYTDDFGIPHWMKFCFIVANTAGDLRYCEHGNEEDSNPEILQQPQH
jgi:hypothetical protein